MSAVDLDVQCSVSQCRINRLAYRAGVTVGITAPTSYGFLSGLSVAFSTGSPHKLAPGAVLQDVAALHVAVGSSALSVSTQIATLRNLLRGISGGELGKYFSQVTKVHTCSVVDQQRAHA